ncbi:hypothetical protein Cgig2_030099 [Carnegiea gigantea]|uniref:Btz domain-containing protein n=1 Tax=Carnegiea gigantea TaxID=171969 RepID=A0A9Q1JNC7_9CARY|nr:hypothetical protein Cgig2_030099 [Carnegiea gigantea]
MPSGRSPNRLCSKAKDKDRDQKHRRRLQDALPLENQRVSHAKAEVNDANRNTNELGETTKNSDPKAVPRSRSYFQHDDHGTASRDGRRTGRRVTSERGWWNNSKDDEDRANRKTVRSGIWEKEGKSIVRGGDHENHVWRHDKFTEVEGDSNPPAKKRRQFREEKLPIESNPAHNIAREPSKATHPVNSTGVSERREERAWDRHPLERRDHDRGYQRERSFSNNGQAEKTGFPSSRDRFNGGDNGSRYRARDRFGGRRGYDSSGTGGRVEKWKHDLFDDANKSPTAKNEEDPIAKVEALLAS